MVVTSSLPHNLPAPKMGNDIIRALDGRTDLCVILTVSLPDSRILRIYRKADQGCVLPPGADLYDDEEIWSRHAAR